MAWRAYSSWAMCVHDGSDPRGECASAAMPYAADLDRFPISRANLFHRRCSLWAPDMVRGGRSSRIKRIRDERAPKGHAAPRSWGAFPYSVDGIFHHANYRARPSLSMARWVVSADSPTTYIQELGAIAWKILARGYFGTLRSSNANKTKTLT